MEEFIGVDESDFEGVDFADSDEEEKQTTSQSTAVATAEATNTNPNLERTHPDLAAPTRLASSSEGARADIEGSQGLQAIQTSNGVAAKVDAERGLPLPEHAYPANEALTLLRRLERCCLESRAEEAEAALGLGSSGRTPDALENKGVMAGSPSEGFSLERVACFRDASPQETEAASSACLTALRLCRGEYEKVLRGTQLFAAPAEGPDAMLSKGLVHRFRAFINGDSPIRRDTTAQGHVTPSDDIASVPADQSRVWRAAEAMWVGAAALSLFWQENYAGPELGHESVARIDSFFKARLGSGNAVTPAAATASNVALACDGEIPFPHSSLASSLLAARLILTLSAEGLAGLPGWFTALAATNAPASDERNSNIKRCAGTSASRNGGAASSEGSHGSAPLACAEGGICRDAAREGGQLSTAAWWAGRACVTHARLLLSPTRSDTLWREARTLFRHAVGRFGGGVPAAAEAATIGRDEEETRRRVGGLVWLEWGLAQHHLQDPSKGKESFARAKLVSGLSATLTGAMGKRTKFQQSEVAQLVLVAASALTSSDQGEPEQGGTHTGDAESSHARSASSEGAALEGRNESKVAPEIGRSTTVGEGDRRAAARQTVHSEDSALLEDISFVQRELEKPGKLQDIDLAIILGLCLDVSNSNPRDGLTNEEMTPYIARVLRQPGCNWMIYSTALLQRAWVEFERSHARDRAALQLQALLDQHTTKLTYTQATIEAVQESAPAHERIRYLASLSYPPRWELRRDLARRYAAMGVFGSAAAEFVELEMWEEAVECYRHMQQLEKAQKLARDRLKVQETPSMLAALGDLTHDADLWERAWELSGRRYARAKACLGRLRLSQGKYEEACNHYEQALAVKPLMTAAWFSLGAARMRLGRWSEALQAFSTVVQQEPEEGEAWGNMGAVHMHEGNWTSAVAAFTEGLKHMPSNWRMWENQAEALLRLGRWRSAVYACHRMLDLSDKSKRGVDENFLALLVEGALREEGGAGPDATPPPLPTVATPAGAVSTATDDLAGRPICKQVAELLGRVVSASSTRGNARVWEVYARFNEGAGRARSKILDCVSKQCRALQKSGWEKDAAAVERLAIASEKLVQLHLEDGTRQSAYQAKMHLATAARKVTTANVCAGCPGHKQIMESLTRVEGVLADLKAKDAEASNGRA